MKSKSKSPLPPFFKGGNSKAGYLRLAERLAERLADGLLLFPPLKKGGRGDFRDRSNRIANYLPDRIHDRSSLQKHFPIIEPQHAQTHLYQHCITHRIGTPALNRKVLATVQFDDQLSCRCIEIHDVLSQWNLPVKLNAADLVTPNAEPQSLFGIGHVTAQPTRIRLQMVGIRSHPGIRSADLLPYEDGIFLDPSKKKPSARIAQFAIATERNRQCPHY